MNERIAVQHFYSSCKLLCRLHTAAQHIADAENKNCTDPFAAAHQAVACRTAHLGFFRQKTAAGLFQRGHCLRQIILILLLIVH